MKTKHIITVLLFIFCSFTNYAQRSQWTLEECIRYAIDHNITIKQLELQKKSSEVDLNTAQNSRLPNLTSSIGQNWNFGRTQIPSGLYENQRQSNTSFSISSSIPLFTGFRIPNEIARNELDLKVAVQNLEKAKEDLALNIASLFLQVLFNKELLKINEEQLALSRYQVERTKELVRYEKVPAAQLSDIEAQAANEEVSVIQADNNLKLALLDLKQSLELEQSLEFDVLTPELGDVITENIGSIQTPQAVFESAVQIKPAIKEQEFRVESAEKTLKIAESGYYPNLNLSMGYGTNYFFQYNINNVNKVLYDQLKNNGGEYIGLSLSIPIFNRFSVRNQVRNARINIENQQWMLENTKKTLFKEIQTAYQNALAAQEKYKASGKAIKAASESFSSASARYESGKSSVFEFNEAKTRLIRSQSEEIQAKYDYIFRTKILDFYNGIPIKL
ncbi:MAG: TolC family protein [Candidatus Symbiothrix sp.]|jgi:outer membrane protein|nr:TolC family protein [Candidatus Symbiothrix sp.]